MGWGKIVKKVKKVGHKIEPHAAGIDLLRRKTSSGARIQGNIEKESVKGTAAYGGYAGLAAQVIPGVGTAVGAGLIAASAAAQIKLKQDAIAEQRRRNREMERQWAAEDAAALKEQSAFSQTTPSEATAPDEEQNRWVRKEPAHSSSLTSTAARYAGNAARNLITDAFPSAFASNQTVDSLVATGAAPAGDSGAPRATGAELMTGAAPESFFDRYRTPVMVASGIAAVLTIVVIVLKR